MFFQLRCPDSQKHVSMELTLKRERPDIFPDPYIFRGRRSNGEDTNYGLPRGPRGGSTGGLCRPFVGPLDRCRHRAVVAEQPAGSTAGPTADQGQLRCPSPGSLCTVCCQCAVHCLLVSQSSVRWEGRGNRLFILESW